MNARLIWVPGLRAETCTSLRSSRLVRSSDVILRNPWDPAKTHYERASAIFLLGVGMIVSSIRSDFDPVLEFFGGLVLASIGVLSIISVWRTIKQRKGSAARDTNA